MKTLPQITNEYAFKMQYEMGCLLEGKKSVNDVLEIYRQSLQSAVKESVKATQIPEPTKDDRKESPTWAEVIDTQREKVENLAKRFINGV